MSVRVRIVEGPLAESDAAPEFPGAGAVVAFEGVVREMEDGRRLAALDYQAYEPMAQKVIAAIGEELVRRHGLVGMIAEHSRGRVGVGKVSFRLVVGAVHRKEALAAMDEFIDRVKRDVPIWKAAVWGEEG